ncbi:MAG: WD40/YVTN/BNR-like repeat-containing protein [Saprospiraceae bacterium]
MQKPVALLVALTVSLATCKKEPLHLPVFREQILPGNSQDLTSVWFTDSLTGYITGGTPWNSGLILSTTDGGSTWHTDTVLANRMECVMFDASGRGYVCGMDGLAFLRWAGEPHWHPFRMDYAWNRGCFFWDIGHGIVVSGEGFETGKARKLGPNAVWFQDTVHQFPNALSAVWLSDSLTAHAVGLGWVLRSDDGGRSWQRLPPTGDFFRSVHFPTPIVGYICGHNGSLLKTTDSGRNWHTLLDSGTFGGEPFRALWFTTENKGYLVGDSGLFWRTENGGSDWIPLAGLPEAADASDIFVLGRRGWITTDGGRIFYFEE